jgi:hypothetical protein
MWKRMDISTLAGDLLPRLPGTVHELVKHDTYTLCALSATRITCCLDLRIRVASDTKHLLKSPSKRLLR